MTYSFWLEGNVPQWRGNEFISAPAGDATQGRRDSGKYAREALDRCNGVHWQIRQSSTIGKSLEADPKEGRRIESKTIVISASRRSVNQAENQGNDTLGMATVPVFAGGTGPVDGTPSRTVPTSASENKRAGTGGNLAVDTRPLTAADGRRRVGEFWRRSEHIVT
ncbi:hypothetical protein B0H16DRAFT_1481533 [Mycena metata]|uniref:Uncharacterized protein n=1 Tax=Mycena metata TaxID=1033252 RepID=A0AAD7MAI3_9AGAR|nr:hypothetical protein B0H16DRAFT_1481533 [Mycena metata]